MKPYHIVLTFTLLALAACVEEPDSVISIGQKVVIRAYQEGAVQTKTSVIDGGTEVYWESGDEISVFFNGSGSKFVSSNTELARVANFSGSINTLIGSNEGTGSSNLIWGLYPYRSDASSDGLSVTTVLPAIQTGRAGSFARNTHISLACANQYDLAFYNVTGGVRFSVTQEGIKSVAFEGNNNENLAGTINLAFGSGVPVVKSVSDNVTRLVLYAPDGESFETGKWYYICAIPAELSKGFNLVFHKEGEYATLITNKSISIKRGVFGSIANADEGLTFIENDTSIADAVELGLRVKWASWNIGASAPEEYGDYFAWGETKPKESYDWTTYKWYNGSEDAFLKYNFDGNYGAIDYKTQLESQDDAAHANWGSNWRMPTAVEWAELINNCTWTWTTVNGFYGYKVTSQKHNFEGNYIFIPAAGYYNGTSISEAGSGGYYWEPSLSANSAYSAISTAYRSSYNTNRSTGLPIRAVYDDRDFISVSSVEFREPNVELETGSCFSLTPIIRPNNATNITYSIKSGDESVALCIGNKVYGISCGSAVLTVYADNGAITAQCSVRVFEPEVPATIDLGLSVSWASYDIGATKPGEFGDYFSFGATEPYYEDGYARSENPVWKPGKGAGYTQENWTSKSAPLALEDDAAHVNWGGLWRMPTQEEMKELNNNCSSSYQYINGILCKLYISKVTGKFILFPAAGHRHETGLYSFGSAGHWRSSTGSVMGFSTSSADPAYYNKYDGVCIRPVCSPKVTSVSLDADSIILSIGGSDSLVATVTPSGGSNNQVAWSSSDPSVASVDSGGKINGIGPGTAIITASSIDGEKTAQCAVSVVECPADEPVDLGLSVKWASVNLGASSPEEPGNYYQWGDLSPKEADGYYSDYKWCDGDYNKLTKYNDDSAYGIVDNKYQLELEDDAANVTLGGNWRIPTIEEWKELLDPDSCSWSLTRFNGISGYSVSSNKNGYGEAFIFIPINTLQTTSLNSYWSSSLVKACNAWNIWVNQYGTSLSMGERVARSRIRPIYGSSVSVSLLENDITLTSGHSDKLSASIIATGTNGGVLNWSSSNPSVATVDSDGLVTGINPGRAIITVTAVESGYSSYCAVLVMEPPTEAAVDLGLSVKWAACNLGASSPEVYGDYYAWGEIEAKESYGWGNYKWCSGTDDTITKYNSDKSYGQVDYKSQLDPEDDVAQVKLGGGWRLPTASECYDLCWNCTVTWTRFNGVNGCRVTSNLSGYKDKCIFFPAAGYRSDTLIGAGERGSYLLSWTATNQLYFNSRGLVFAYQGGVWARYLGSSVRPVIE